MNRLKTTASYRELQNHYSLEVNGKLYGKFTLKYTLNKDGTYNGGVAWQSEDNNQKWVEVSEISRTNTKDARADGLAMARQHAQITNGNLTAINL